MFNVVIVAPSTSWTQCRVPTPQKGASNPCWSVLGWSCPKLPAEQAALCLPCPSSSLWLTWPPKTTAYRVQSQISMCHPVRGPCRNSAPCRNAARELKFPVSWSCISKVTTNPSNPIGFSNLPVSSPFSLLPPRPPTVPQLSSLALWAMFVCHLCFCLLLFVWLVWSIVYLLVYFVFSKQRLVNLPKDEENSVLQDTKL